jgi:prepilin-type N-terminal cleavage/methylation domain-containing protein
MKKGLTLLEIMVSVTILSITIISVYGLLYQIYTSNNKNEERVICYKACQEVMERLLAMDYQQMLRQDGVRFDVKRILPGRYAGKIRIKDVSPQPSKKISEIEVSVVCQGYGKDINVRIVTRRAK